jgi:hypothetical protein
VSQFQTIVDNRHRGKKAVASLPRIIRFSPYWPAALMAAAFPLGAQESPQPGGEDKRILWIFTNHRTTDDSAELPPLTPGGASILRMVFRASPNSRDACRMLMPSKEVYFWTATKCPLHGASWSIIPLPFIARSCQSVSQ